MKTIIILLPWLLLSNCAISQSQPNTLKTKSYEVLVDKTQVSEKELGELANKLDYVTVIELDSNLVILHSDVPKKSVRDEFNSMLPEAVEALGRNSYKNIFFTAAPSGTSKRIKEIAEKRGGEYTVVNLAPQKLVHLSLTQGFDMEHGFAEPSSFFLPLKKDSVVVVEKGRYRQEGDQTIFTGTLDQNSGEVFLISRGDSVSGVINTLHKTYSIVPVGDGQHIIMETSAQYGDEEPKRFLEKNKKQDAQDAQDNPGSGRLEENEQVEIRLLILYSEAVDEFYSKNAVRELVIPSIERTNQTLIDSGVGNIKFVLGAAHKVSYLESPAWDNHLDVMLNPNDGVMDNIFALRNQSKSDIVVLIVKTEGSICGEAASIGPDMEKAFVVVRASCSLNYYSFGHEIGHLFGCRHDVDVDPDITPFSYGHGFIKKSLVPWRCVMSYGNYCNGCQRLGLWSNPSLLYQGTIVGTKERENNAEVLRQSAKAIAGFR